MELFLAVRLAGTCSEAENWEWREKQQQRMQWSLYSVFRQKIRYGEKNNNSECYSQGVIRCSSLYFLLEL